jgi:hypothetical protein
LNIPPPKKKKVVVVVISLSLVAKKKHTCVEQSRERAVCPLGNIPPSVVSLLLLSASNPIIDDKKGNRREKTRGGSYIYTAETAGSSFVPSEGVSHIKRRRRREREDGRFY